MTRTYDTITTDIRNCYKTLADSFCKYYYSFYDINLLALNNLFYPNTQFTFNNEELYGFNNFVNKLNSLGYYKFTHYTMEVNSQPIGPNHLLLNIYGIMSVNDSILRHKFIETILIQKDLDQSYHIYSVIFKFVQ